MPETHPPPDNDLYAYSYAEVAERLGVSVLTIKRLVYSNQLRARKVGRRVLIPASAIREFLTEQTTTS